MRGAVRMDYGTHIMRIVVVLLRVPFQPLVTVAVAICSLNQ